MRWRQGAWKFPTVTAIMIGLANGFHSGVTTGPEYDQVATGLVMFMGTAIVMFLVAFWTPRLVRPAGFRRLFRSLGRRTMDVGDEGLHITDNHSTATVSWSRFDGFLETPDTFVVYTSLGWQVVRLDLLPKRALEAEADLEKLREHLNRHLTNQGRPTLRHRLSESPEDQGLEGLGSYRHLPPTRTHSLSNARRDT